MKSPVARLCVNIYYKGISKNLAHKTIDLSDVYVKKNKKIYKITPRPSTDIGHLYRTALSNVIHICYGFLNIPVFFFFSK